MKKITLDALEYEKSIEGIIFASYYAGFETIEISAKGKMDKGTRKRIHRLINYMSGTEITNEDERTVTINVLLDSNRVDLRQVIYRLGLIITSSFTNVTKDNTEEKIETNENEIDRLHHLITKIASLSLSDSKTLHTSRIEYMQHVPCFILIGKHLESIGDIIRQLFDHEIEQKEELDSLFEELGSELERALKYLLKKQKSFFEKIEQPKRKQLETDISRIDNTIMRRFMDEILKYIISIQEEIVTISFQNEITRNSKTL